MPAEPAAGGTAATPDARARFGGVVIAALALPGLADAQSDPPAPLVAFKWLDYQDWQPGLKRVSVTSPSLYARATLGERWGIEGSFTTDSVAGATPRWHTSVSGASRQTEFRRAGDVKVTRYGDRRGWSLGAAASKEHDFESAAASAELRLASDDNNRTWNLGAAVTRDRIGATVRPDLDERRRTLELAAGVTQAVSRSDLVQAGLTLARGRGHYSDPYKFPDERPRERDQAIATLRWNHHFEAASVTLRGSYRYYRDSFGIRSHTLGLEPVVPIGESVVLTPVLRLYSQTAARFYYDPVYSFVGEPFPPGYVDEPPRFISPDQRLSAFGAVTLGAKIAWKIDPLWTVDLKVEHYRQRGAWQWQGRGSPGLARFSARWVQWGVARSF